MTTFNQYSQIIKITLHTHMINAIKIPQVKYSNIVLTIKLIPNFIL